MSKNNTKMSEAAEPSQVVDEKTVQPSKVEVSQAVVEETIPTSQAEASQDNQIKIYCGASLPSLGIKANTVFKGKTPKELDRDYIKDLVIPVQLLPQFLKKKMQANSREAFCYKKSIELAAELKREV